MNVKAAKATVERMPARNKSTNGGLEAAPTIGRSDSAWKLLLNRGAEAGHGETKVKKLV
jgi:hypothetical protein